MWFSLHFNFSIFKKAETAHVYDELNDGSTTDGSISILGDNEFNQSRHNLDADDLSSHTSSPQPMQMWLRCTPIDMTICTKRTLITRQHRAANLIQELTLPPQNIAEDIFNYLERLNNYLSNTYLFQVILLFLTATSLATLAVIYSRYIHHKYEIKDLQQKLFNVEIQKYEMESNLQRCEYRYRMDVENKMKEPYQSVRNVPETIYEYDDSIDSIKIPTKQINANCETSNDLTGECLIQPTKLIDANQNDDETNLHHKNGKKVWTGDGNTIDATIKPIDQSKEFHYLNECDDENGLFSEYNREFCEQRNKYHGGMEKPIAEIIYSTHSTFKQIDNSKCNPSKIELNLGLEHARNILRETNCDDESTLKTLEEMYSNHMRTIHPEENRFKREHKKVEKTKLDKSKEKLEKTEKYQRGDKRSSSEESIERNENKKRQVKDRENKKDRKVKDKENKKPEKKRYNNPDSVELKENERKRSDIKVYDRQRYHDDDFK